mgnify:CR=1 FL=1
MATLDDFVSFLQGASNSAASNLSAPVDGINWLLGKAGLPVSKAPVGGSVWLRQAGFTAEPKNRNAGLLGEFVGGVMPIVAAAKAPQIAAWLNQAGRNLSAPRTLNPQAGAIVWHGSPHKFNKFSTDKIGTGEGAQAYGHGLYFAESPEVADIYRKTLTQSDDYVDGQLLDSTIPKHFLARVLNDESGNVGAAKDSLTAFAMPGGSKSVAESAKQALKLLESGERPVLQTIKPDGALYKTDIPDEAVARFLDWDKPLSQQAPEVRKVLQRLAEDGQDFYPTLKEMMQPFEAGNTTGQAVYHALQREGGNAVNATRELKSAGIPGIRYLDGGSRGAGQGSSNFVAFDPDLIRILERNGQATGAVPWQPGEWRGLLGNN